MPKILAAIFSLKTIKCILRVLASLASAILFVSGYLFFISNTDKERDPTNGRKPNRSQDD
jgi:hypothetical protein